MMKPTACPFLGMKDDPTTALNFPSGGNLCHKARTAASISKDHQETYCLTEAFSSCPVYQRTKPAPLPSALSAAAEKKRINPYLAIPIIILFLLAVFLTSSELESWAILPFNLIPPTGKTNQAIIPNQFMLHPLVPSSTAARMPTATLRGTVKTKCPTPDGWVTYIVNPTDSLFRLSVVFRIRVDQLQAANCMGNETVILPGMILNVPFIPTTTPSATSTVRQQPRITQTATPQPEVINPIPATQPPGNEPPPPTSTIQPTDIPAPPGETLQPTTEPNPPEKKPKPTKKPKDGSGDTSIINLLTIIETSFHPEGLP